MNSVREFIDGSLGRKREDFVIVSRNNFKRISCLIDLSGSPHYREVEFIVAIVVQCLGSEDLVRQFMYLAIDLIDHDHLAEAPQLTVSHCHFHPGFQGAVVR